MVEKQIGKKLRGIDRWPNMEEWSDVYGVSFMILCAFRLTNVITLELIHTLNTSGQQRVQQLDLLCQAVFIVG